jgi:hypothetical protein
MHVRVHARWLLVAATKRFRAPAGTRVTSPLLVQRRSNQEETTPRWRALQASCLAGARAGYGVFRQHILCWRKTGRHPCRPPCGLSFAHPPCHRGPGRAARPKRAEARAHSAAASGAHDARLLFRGPWAAVRWGRKGRAAGETRDGLAFSRGQEPARKARPRLTHLPGRRPGKRQPGWPSLWVTFLLATQEKSNSVRGSGPKPL